MLTGKELNGSATKTNQDVTHMQGQGPVGKTGNKSFAVAPGLAKGPSTHRWG
jgi:hypothetical protein